MTLVTLLRDMKLDFLMSACHHVNNYWLITNNVAKHFIDYTIKQNPATYIILPTYQTDLTNDSGVLQPMTHRQNGPITFLKPDLALHRQKTLRVMP